MAKKEKESLPAGTVVGSYRLLELVGQGGMGSVYRAHDKDENVVALKVLASDLNNNEVQRSRFYQEAEIARRLNHPNLVKALEVGEDKGTHFFAMEFVDGTSLGNKLRYGKMDETEAVRIIIGVAQALHKAHKEGLVHRDVKPDNIMITADGAVKLADMGLVKQLDGDLNLTKTGRGLGTPHFMAPEQFRDAKHADVRCDIYSLGATLYMMVTGEIPFRGSGPLDTFLKKSKNDFTLPEEINPDLTPNLANCIKLAMHANPEKRPASAREFVEMLRGQRAVPTIGKEDVKGASAPPPKEKRWFVIYTDADGSTQKIKGTSAAIKQEIRRGKFDGTAKIGRDRKGPFQHIQELEEFRECLSEVNPFSPTGDRSLDSPRKSRRYSTSNPLPPDREAAKRQLYLLAAVGIMAGLVLGLIVLFMNS